MLNCAGAHLHSNNCARAQLHSTNCVCALTKNPPAIIMMNPDNDNNEPYSTNSDSSLLIEPLPLLIEPLPLLNQRFYLTQLYSIIIMNLNNDNNEPLLNFTQTTHQTTMLNNNLALYYTPPTHRLQPRGDEVANGFTCGSLGPPFACHKGPEGGELPVRGLSLVTRLDSASPCMAFAPPPCCTASAYLGAGWCYLGLFLWPLCSCAWQRLLPWHS